MILFYREFQSEKWIMEIHEIWNFDNFKCMTIWQVKYFIEDLNEHILSPLLGAFNHWIEIWIFIFYFYFLLYDFYFSFLSFIPFIVSQTVKCNYNDNVLSLLNWIIINLNKFNAHQIQNSNSYIPIWLTEFIAFEWNALKWMFENK